MGVLIWVLANIYIGESSLVLLISDALSPIGRMFGLDGAILLAFILGIPANEIVIPLLIMIYSSVGVLPADISLASVRELFLLNGWTVGTAVCCATFALFHWPCSTSLITVYKETKSIKNTILAFIIPSVTGLALCFIINILL
jgi:ferrous iron transport protein B